MLRKLVLVLLLTGGLLYAVAYSAGVGLFSDIQHAGEPSARAVSPALVEFKTDTVRESALEVGVARPKQILFGDLHVHSTFSFDAFTLSLPMAGGGVPTRSRTPVTSRVIAPRSTSGRSMTTRSHSRRGAGARRSTRFGNAMTSRATSRTRTW